MLGVLGPCVMCYVLSDSWADHNFRGKVKLGEERQEGEKKKKEGEKFKLTLSQCRSDKVQTGSCVLNTASTDPEGGAEEAAVARSRPIKRPRNGLVGLTGLVVLPSILCRVALFPLCVVQNQGQAAMPMPATPCRAASSGSVTTGERVSEPRRAPPEMIGKAAVWCTIPRLSMVTSQSRQLRHLASPSLSPVHCEMRAARKTASHSTASRAEDGREGTHQKCRLAWHHPPAPRVPARPLRLCTREKPKRSCCGTISAHQQTPPRIALALDAARPPWPRREGLR